MPLLNLMKMNVDRLHKIKDKLNAKSVDDAAKALLGMEYRKSEAPKYDTKMSGIALSLETHNQLASTAKANNETLAGLFGKLMDEFEQDHTENT